MEVKRDIIPEVRLKEKFQFDGTDNAPPPLQNGDDGNNFGGFNENQELSKRNAIIAMILFLGAEVMLFAGLIGAFITFKFGAEVWPPSDQPRLPLDITTVNTLVLLLSGGFMVRALRLLKSYKTNKIKNALWITLILGIVFLSIQGFEWMRLISYGVTLKSGVFGGTFYLLIGCHAIHCIGAVLWLGIATFKFNKSSARSQSLNISLAGMYWLLVVLLWPVLFIFVYL